MTFFDQHRQRMVDRFIWLRGIDAEYARAALQEYLADRNCPFPEIEQDVKKAWHDRNKSGVA